MIVSYSLSLTSEADRKSKRMDRELFDPDLRQELMNSGLKIQSPRSMVKEDWFLDAITDAPDYLYVLAKPFVFFKL